MTSSGQGGDKFKEDAQKKKKKRRSGEELSMGPKDGRGVPNDIGLG